MLKVNKIKFSERKKKKKKTNLSLYFT